MINNISYSVPQLPPDGPKMCAPCIDLGFYHEYIGTKYMFLKKYNIKHKNIF